MKGSCRLQHSKDQDIIIIIIKIYTALIDILDYRFLILENAAPDYNFCTMPAKKKLLQLFIRQLCLYLSGWP